MLDNLASLVDKSLVRQHEGVGGEPRFSMLETIREYAAEQAAGRGFLEGLRERHAAVFADLAREASALVMGSASAAGLIASRRSTATCAPRSVT